MKTWCNWEWERIVFILLLLLFFVLSSPTKKDTWQMSFFLSLSLAVTINIYAYHMYSRYVLLFQVLCSCSHQWKAHGDCVSEWWSKWTLMNRSAHKRRDFNESGVWGEIENGSFSIQLFYYIRNALLLDALWE